jgi:hypothetical protein
MGAMAGTRSTSFLWGGLVRKSFTSCVMFNFTDAPIPRLQNDDVVRALVCKPEMICTFQTNVVMSEEAGAAGQNRNAGAKQTGSTKVWKYERKPLTTPTPSKPSKQRFACSSPGTSATATVDETRTPFSTSTSCPHPVGASSPNVLISADKKGDVYDQSGGVIKPTVTGKSKDNTGDALVESLRQHNFGAVQDLVRGGAGVKGAWLCGGDGEDRHVHGVAEGGEERAVHEARDGAQPQQRRGA